MNCFFLDTTCVYHEEELKVWKLSLQMEQISRSQMGLVLYFILITNWNFYSVSFISSLTHTGFSAVHLAAKNGQPECLKRLLQVEHMWTFVSVTSRTVIRNVFQERLPVDCTDSIGRTPLHHAGYYCGYYSQKPSWLKSFLWYFLQQSVDAYPVQRYFGILKPT